MNPKLLFFLLMVTQFSFSQNDIIGTIKTKIVQKRELAYALHIPKNALEKKPLIIFLHGSGEKGMDIEKVKVHGPLKYLKSHVLDAYVLAPQCPENEYWDEEVLHKLILKIQKEHNIDINRIISQVIAWEPGGLGIWLLHIPKLLRL